MKKYLFILLSMLPIISIAQYYNPYGSYQQQQQANQNAYNMGRGIGLYYQGIAALCEERFSDAYDMFWDIFHEDRGIKLYGTKCIKTIDNGFMYEAVVFDEFPKDRESYSICIGYIEEEETYIELVSDTCIR